MIVKKRRRENNRIALRSQRRKEKKSGREGKGPASLGCTTNSVLSDQYKKKKRKVLGPIPTLSARPAEGKKRREGRERRRKRGEGEGLHPFEHRSRLGEGEGGKKGVGGKEAGSPHALDDMKSVQARG